MMIKHMRTIAVQKVAADFKVTVKNTDTSSSLFPQDKVITIPGDFTDAQRRALLVGREISGITGVLHSMHEMFNFCFFFRTGNHSRRNEKSWPMR